MKKKKVRTLPVTEKEELLAMTEDVLWHYETELSLFSLRVEQSGIRVLFSYDSCEKSTQQEAFDQYIEVATPMLEDYYKALLMYDRFNAIPVEDDDETR